MTWSGNTCSGMMCSVVMWSCMWDMIRYVRHDQVRFDQVKKTWSGKKTPLFHYLFYDFGSFLVIKLELSQSLVDGHASDLSQEKKLIVSRYSIYFFFIFYFLSFSYIFILFLYSIFLFIFYKCGTFLKKPCIHDRFIIEENSYLFILILFFY